MAMPSGLVIGCQALSVKDEAVLRALVRVLDGGLSARLRFSDVSAECNVLFVAPDMPHTPALANAVQIDVRPHDPHGPLLPAPERLWVALPLRMSNVLPVLEQAAPRVLYQPAEVAPEQSLRTLFVLIGENLSATERRRMVVPLGSGQQIILDFVQQQLHTAMPLDLLLGGRYAIGAPHRVSVVEEELIRAVPRHSLGPVLWHMEQRLAAAGAVAPPRPGRYRLRRWPDASGLTAPGHPRLAALLTSRAMTIEEASEAASASAQVVAWFLEACLAQAIAVREEADTSALPPTLPALPTLPTHAPAKAAQATGWIGSLRKRLKLW